MENEEVCKVLNGIARLLELKKENPFKVRAYRRAAEVLKRQPEPIEQLAREGRLREVPGVGEAIARKVTELVTTGRLEFYEKLRSDFPEVEVDEP